MKLKNSLLAAIIAALAGTTPLALAADEKPATAPSAGEKPIGVKVDDEKAAKAKKKVKPHSHMEEKTGMSASMPSDKSAPDKPLHDHRKEHK